MISTTQDGDRTTLGALEIAVFRFSARPTESAAFLELVGLDRRVSNAAGTWLELQGERGVVNLHGADAVSTTDAEPGSTDLVLIARDVTAFAGAAEGIDGIEVDVWDEAFGRQATVSYQGRKITINEIQSDPYGYEVQRPTPGPVVVVCHCYGSNLDQLRNLLLVLGFREVASDPADESSRLESGDAAGVIVLHPEHGSVDGCRLGLETAEGLDAVRDRLRNAGFRPQADAAGRLEVTDPDGQPVLITARG